MRATLSILRAAALTILLALLLVAPVQAGEEAGKARRTIPESIAGLPYQKAHRFSDERLGIVLSYGGGGAFLDIYIYNGGYQEIPADIESPRVLAQFEQAKSDVLEAVRHKLWDQVSFSSEGVVEVGPREAPVRMREAVFQVKKGGAALRSYLYLTAGKNLFFKVRYTTVDAGGHCKGPSRDALLRDLGAVISGWLRAQ